MIALPTGDTVRAVAMVGVVVLAAAPAGRPARGGGRQLGTGPPEMDRTRPRLAAGAACRSPPDGATQKLTTAASPLQVERFAIL